MEKADENRCRRQLASLGYVLRKSRARIHWGPEYADNKGGYMIVHLDSNTIVEGEKFDLTLDGVAAFIAEKKAS